MGFLRRVMRLWTFVSILCLAILTVGSSKSKTLDFRQYSRTNFTKMSP